MTWVVGRQETSTPPKYTELSQQEYAVIYEAYPHTVREVINTNFQERWVIYLLILEIGFIDVSNMIRIHV